MLSSCCSFGGGRLRTGPVPICGISVCSGTSGGHRRDCRALLTPERFLSSRSVTRQVSGRCELQAGMKRLLVLVLVLVLVLRLLQWNLPSTDMFHLRLIQFVSVLL